MGGGWDDGGIDLLQRSSGLLLLIATILYERHLYLKYTYKNLTSVTLCIIEYSDFSDIQPISLFIYFLFIFP